MNVDVVTLGEAMLRLTIPSGTRLSDASELKASIGGAESNVAVALARMGCSAAWVSALPENQLGQKVLRHLVQQGVDTQFVVRVPDTRLGLYFVEPGAAPRPIEVLYDRKNSAINYLQATDVPWEVVESAKAVHITGITPALSDSLRTLALEFTRKARSAGVAVCVDVNYRSRLWDSKEARVALLELCHEATLVILTEEDAQDVFELSGSSAKLATEAQKLFSAKYVALTRGANGSILTDGNRSVEQAGMDAEVVDRIGSGDAFAAGLILGVINDDVVNSLPTATAMAVLTLGIQGDQFLADTNDVTAVLAQTGREVTR